MALLRRSLAACLCFVAVCVTAGQPVQPPQPRGEGENLFEVLNEQLKQTRKVNVTQEGVEMVAPTHARVCDVCQQPLYKHDDKFECVPLDPKTGLPRKVLKIRTKPAHCPACTASFNGALPGNVNDQAGRDRDFCAHSVGKYSVHSSVWLCPTCGYAGRIDSWGMGFDGKPLTEDVKKFVREKLQPETRQRMIEMAGLQKKGNEPIPEDLLGFASYVTQTEIPDWLKCEHAIRIGEAIKAPASVLAPLYMEAAHACRREVFAEVAVPGLQNDLQVSLGKSIRRINHYINSESLEIRRNRGESVLDPTRQETDPVVLTQAAKSIIKKGEDLAAQLAKIAAAQNKTQQDDRFFTSGDMFVLHISYAGILDRLGALDEARAALDKALTFIPQKLTVNVDNQPNQDLQDYYDRQMKLLRKAVEDRKKCVERERDYLFKAARTNMAAVKFGEVSFVRYQNGLAVAEVTRGLDAAPTCYILGELLRRVGDVDSAAYCFDASLAVSTKLLGDLDALGFEKSKLSAQEYDRQRARWQDLKEWSTDQRKLCKNAKGPDAYVAEVIQQALTSAGFAALIPNAAAAAPEQATTPETPVKPVTVTTPAVKPETPKELPKVNVSQPAATASGTITTRDDMYKLYYAAIMKYRKDLKENPPTLAELVKSGYIKQAESNLDAAGKLICPETNEKMVYSRVWEPGDATAPILYSVPKPNSKRLWANGDIRSPEAGKN